VLTHAERDCLARYCALLARQLPDLEGVRMFGSAARGDMWPDHSPHHSDIDLLVVTRDEVPEALQEALVDETYALFLECGRQLSPQFFPAVQLTAPHDERTRTFLAQVEADGVDVWSSR